MKESAGNLSLDAAKANIMKAAQKNRDVASSTAGYCMDAILRNADVVPCVCVCVCASEDKKS